MLTGIMALAAGYLGVNGATFAIAKIFARPAGELAKEAHLSGEYHRNLFWALDMIDKEKLEKEDQEKYKELMGRYVSDSPTASNINLRSSGA